MYRNDIADALCKVTDGQAFITLAQLTKAMGRADPQRVKKAYLKDLEAIDGKYYLIREVAERMQQRCRI